MTVRELIEKLKEYPEDSLVMTEVDDIWIYHEIDEIHQSTVTYGILTKNPVTHQTVVLT